MITEIQLRSVRDQDLAFVFAVFSEVRSERFAALGLPRQQLEPLLELQFQAQQAQFRQQFPKAEFDLIEVGGEPVGYLYADRGSEAFTLVDIALLSGSRGAGLGGRIVRQLIDAAAAAGRPVRAHVEKTNRAQHLWQRLGFRVIGDDGVHLELECPPAG